MSFPSSSLSRAFRSTWQAKAEQTHEVGEVRVDGLPVRQDHVRLIGRAGQARVYADDRPAASCRPGKVLALPDPTARTR